MRKSVYPVLHVRRERALFRLSLPHEMGAHAYRTWHYSSWLARLTWPELIAIPSAFVCAGKNIINLVQLWKASKILVGVDLAERAHAREVLAKE